MKPYIENNKGHKWVEIDGAVDIFAFCAGTCNGPKCEKCGYEFCHHCQDIPDKECPAKEKSK